MKSIAKLSKLRSGNKCERVRKGVKVKVSLRKLSSYDCLFTYKMRSIMYFTITLLPTIISEVGLTSLSLIKCVPTYVKCLLLVPYQQATRRTTLKVSGPYCEP